jgi:two-component sensor histidine kinase
LLAVIVVRSPWGDIRWFWVPFALFWPSLLELPAPRPTKRQRLSFWVPLLSTLGMMALASRVLTGWAIDSFGIWLVISSLYPQNRARRSLLRAQVPAWRDWVGPALMVLALDVLAATGRGQWRSLTGDPREDLLLRLGAVALLATISSWVRETRAALQRFRDARDHALRLKLAPHFIFNTLNTLKAQLERDPREASATVDRLSALYRQILERTDRPTIPLREELAFVEAYLGIERVRLGERLRVAVDVPEALEAHEIPTLGLQVLVENAIKHGVATREAGGELRIRAWIDRYDSWKLWIAVENTASQGRLGLEAGTGTGLETLRARLQRPGHLQTEERDGLFRAQFQWNVRPAAA